MISSNKNERSILEVLEGRYDEPVAVLKNSLSEEEADQMADEWADHKGLRMTLAETLAHAARQQPAKQLAE